jgi:hypothetical protein
VGDPLDTVIFIFLFFKGNGIKILKKKLEESHAARCTQKRTNKKKPNYFFFLQAELFSAALHSSLFTQSSTNRPLLLPPLIFIFPLSPARRSLSLSALRSLLTLQPLSPSLCCAANVALPLSLFRRCRIRYQYVNL